MKILVVGAGIAGSAVAFLLQQDGHEVQVVDAAPQPHAGGYQIQLDATALAVIERIGALDVVHKLSAPAAAITVVRKHKQLFSFEMNGYKAARRGDLVGAISRRVSKTVPMQFDRELVSLEHKFAGIKARYRDGDAEEFDLVIGADGVNSTVRQLAIESGRSYVYHNGRIHLWVNVPGRVAGTSRAAILFGDGLAAEVFPYTDRDETLVLASLNIGTGRAKKTDLLPVVAQWLRSSAPQYARFADDLLIAPDSQIRVTRFAQVRAPRWHSRNVVLIGDSAHCIDPLSGAGAHGALLGAWNFVEELRRTPSDISGAATRYTRRTRPFVRSTQMLTAGLLESATAGSIRDRMVSSRLRDAAVRKGRRADPRNTN